MGCVFLAEDTRVNQPRAIKIMLSQRAQNQDLIRRFIRESRALTELNHINVVKAYEMGEHDGTWFLVMEFCEGQTLDDLCAAAPVPVTFAADIIRQAALGLGYAHDHGLIHRDIKPGNIIVTADRVAKLLDFGLLKSLADEKTCLTQTGFILGTPEYIAPEQANGEPLVDGRLDIYSLGCCLYYLLTGRPPFDDAKGYIVIAKHVHDPLPDPRIYRPETPEELVNILRKMTAKRPDDRFQSCKEVAKAIESISSLTPPKPPSEKITIPSLRPVPQSDPLVLKDISQV
jgi:serine/threonine-protein kinase